MRISIFGMGYVGTVSGACLAELGHSVIGVDTNERKVESLNAGTSPVIEERIGEIVRAQVQRGSLSATTDGAAAVRDSDVSFISVGTPSAPNGSLSLSAVKKVVEQIGKEIAAKNAEHTVVVRSTVLPGTTEGVLRPILERAAGRAIGDRLNLCFNPEFLREGSSVKDFYAPPFNVLGSLTEQGYTLLASIYEGIDTETFKVSCNTAESVKYLSNIFHAVKIAFTNECGSVLKKAGVDAREVMEIFVKDERLNISKSYLRPGFAFGGSCLPKDLRAFVHLAQEADIDIPFLRSVLPSNNGHIDRAFTQIVAKGRNRVALFGLTFKPGTDDLRESALVTLAEKLFGQGYELMIYDPNVELSALVGANRAFIENEIPHLKRLLTNAPDALIDWADTVVIGHADGAAREALAAMPPDKRVIDLTGVSEAATSGASYEGICW